VLLVFFWSQLPSRAESEKFASDLRGKVIVGYQGWFGCPGDDQSNQSWSHWSIKTPDINNLVVDMLPATDEYKPSDLCACSNLRHPDGSPVYLFSSLNPNVVKVHFQWMQNYGIDGVAAQRFIVDVATPDGRQRRDKVLENIRAAAEASGRVFFVTYDISQANASTVTRDIENDWQHLVDDLKITSSPNYMRYRNKPVLQLWGFGFNDHPGEPPEVKALITKLKAGTPQLSAVTLIGGVPACWRLLIGDAKTDLRWAEIYRMYDVISPWLVNRFGDELHAFVFMKTMVQPDLDETKRLGIDYMPVIFPGFSWYNLMHEINQPNKGVLNRVPRNGGKFYLKQISELVALHVNMMYVAMFDEVNEGTAVFKVETDKKKLPQGAHLVYPGLDGADLAPDRFLKITGLAGKYLRNSLQPAAPAK